MSHATPKCPSCRKVDISLTDFAACSVQNVLPPVGQVRMSRGTAGPRKAHMLHWKEGEGDSCSLELYVPPLPRIFPPTKGTLPLVPTHKEFLGHCWAHHDNWLLNKAFLLGILPFTGECGRGGQSKEGEKEEGGWVMREGGGAWNDWEGTVEVAGVRPGLDRREMGNGDRQTKRAEEKQDQGDR